jgi:hypothetical protein
VQQIQEVQKISNGAERLKVKTLRRWCSLEKVQNNYRAVNSKGASEGAIN